jgi:hypothetical protein
VRGLAFGGQTKEGAEVDTALAATTPTTTPTTLATPTTPTTPTIDTTIATIHTTIRTTSPTIPTTSRVTRLFQFLVHPLVHLLDGHPVVVRLRKGLVGRLRQLEGHHQSSLFQGGVDGRKVEGSVLARSGEGLF